MKFYKRFSGVERDDIVDKSHQYLMGGTGDNPGHHYITLRRRLSEEIINKFRIGYMPAGVNHQLAGRVIFPIYDPSSHLIAVSSRAIDSSGNLPVYWHEEYQKQFYLYGMHIAKESIRHYGFVIVVEGQFDVLQLHNYGITNVIGLGSTNLSDFQLAIIYRYCTYIVFVFDKDKNLAGQKGSSKATELCGKRNIKMATVDLGEFTDPDSFVLKYGAEKFKELIRVKLRE